MIVQEKGNRRDKSLDALKLLAIFLVLWGHCVQHLLSSDPWSEPVYRAIYSFHMPLFMLLVGYFAKSLTKLSLKEMVIKKFYQLLLPAITFSLLSISFNLLKDIINQDLRLTEYAVKILSNFWFLRSAFCCSVLFWVFSTPHRYRYLSLTLSILFVWCVNFCLQQNYFINTFNLSRMYPCFVCGFIIGENIDAIRRYSKWLLLGSVLLFVFMYRDWNDLAWQSTPFIISVPFQVIIGVAGSFALFMLFGLLGKKLVTIQRTQ